MPAASLLTRRTRALASATRSEVLTSIAAALAFVALFAWRVSVQPVFWVAGIACTLVWFAVILHRNRRAHSPDPALPSLDFYVAHLELRRAHLASAWLWYGPLAIALLCFAGVAVQAASPDASRVIQIAPLLLLLGVSVALGVRRRRRESALLKREIDELRSAGGAP